MLKTIFTKNLKSWRQIIKNYKKKMKNLMRPNRLAEELIISILNQNILRIFLTQLH